jgi:hypothetical protein
MRASIGTVEFLIDHHHANYPRGGPVAIRERVAERPVSPPSPIAINTILVRDVP